jgi:mRNA interferase MazF
MPLKRGNIVLLPFPWTDLKSYTLRPALVISDDSYNKNSTDAIFLFITTKEYKGLFDFRLRKTDSSYTKTGLQTASTFRMGKLATLEQKLAKRRLGYADATLLKKIESGLKLLLNL